MATWLQVLSGIVPPAIVGAPAFDWSSAPNTCTVPLLLTSHNPYDAPFGPVPGVCVHFVVIAASWLPSVALGGAWLGLIQASIVIALVSFSAVGLPSATCALPPVGR